MAHYLSVGKHQLYVEECGNKEGVPVIFLHGGPGSGCSPDHRRFFDPATYRVILFDQRGSGRSQPIGETSNNTTQDLVSDIEAIREHLEITNWLLFGGSWGATLSLAYALAYPARISGMILRGTFLARESDIEWFFFGLKRLFPEAWNRLSRNIPNCRTSADLIGWYYRAVHGDDENISLQAARSWSAWGNHMVHWHIARTKESSPERATEKNVQRERLLAKVKIETHYAYHRYFIDENELLYRIDSLPSIPVSIVHGNFDLTCTMESAWLLHQAIPDSRFIQLGQAGHLIEEPAMISALVEETDRFRATLKSAGSDL
ncbi:MAG: prolyl aminopeptidase [Candidatus Thiodiazotropha sp. DIVDIV]